MYFTIVFSSGIHTEPLPQFAVKSGRGLPKNTQHQKEMRMPDQLLRLKPASLTRCGQDSLLFLIWVGSEARRAGEIKQTFPLGPGGFPSNGKNSGYKCAINSVQEKLSSTSHFCVLIQAQPERIPLQVAGSTRATGISGGHGGTPGAVVRGSENLRGGGSSHAIG